MKKKDAALGHKILSLARNLLAAGGPEAINIRTIAQQANIATGTVYNYFPSKEDILLALTEDYWRTTLEEMHLVIHASSFVGQLEEIYSFLHRRLTQSGEGLMSSLGNVRASGLRRMEGMQSHLRTALVYRMDQDPAIRQTVWTDAFTREQYADFILGNMMLLLQSRSGDIAFFAELVRRTLY